MNNVGLLFNNCQSYSYFTCSTCYIYIPVTNQQPDLLGMWELDLTLSFPLPLDVTRLTFLTFLEILIFPVNSCHHSYTFALRWLFINVFLITKSRSLIFVVSLTLFLTISHAAETSRLWCYAKGLSLAISNIFPNIRSWFGTFDSQTEQILCWPYSLSVSLPLLFGPCCILGLERGFTSYPYLER